MTVPGLEEALRRCPDRPTGTELLPQVMTSGESVRVVARTLSPTGPFLAVLTDSKLGTFQVGGMFKKRLVGDWIPFSDIPDFRYGDYPSPDGRPAKAIIVETSDNHRVALEFSPDPAGLAMFESFSYELRRSLAQSRGALLDQFLERDDVVDCLSALPPAERDAVVDAIRVNEAFSDLPREERILGLFPVQIGGAPGVMTVTPKRAFHFSAGGDDPARLWNTWPGGISSPSTENSDLLVVPIQDPSLILAGPWVKEHMVDPGHMLVIRFHLDSASDSIHRLKALLEPFVGR